MQTLHLRAEESTIKMLLDFANKLSKNGKQVEVLDSLALNQEQAMILRALKEEQEAKVLNHDDLWSDLLK